MVVVGLAIGEAAELEFSEIGADSWAAFIFLVFIGSIAAFTAYNWLLRNVAISTVATYAFVNPVIAVILGWLIAGESMTGQMLIGAGIVVGSVVLITSQNSEENEAETDVHESIGPNRPSPRYST